MGGCERERGGEREKPQARDDGHVSFLNHGGRFAVKVIASFSPVDGYGSALRPKPFNHYRAVHTLLDETLQGENVLNETKPSKQIITEQVPTERNQLTARNARTHARARTHTHTRTHAGCLSLSLCVSLSQSLSVCFSLSLSLSLTRAHTHLRPPRGQEGSLHVENCVIAFC